MQQTQHVPIGALVAWQTDSQHQTMDQMAEADELFV
jgi:hypothetical protein